MMAPDSSLSQLEKTSPYKNKCRITIEYIHELNIAHCIRDKCCKQGITNFNVGVFNFVINIA